jgi:hypothetical protein
VQVGAPAFDVVIVNAVGVMPDTAVEAVRVWVTVIVAGLAAEPVTNTGAERVLVLVVPWLPGTQARAPPVVIFAKVFALVTQMFEAGLY